MYCIFITHSLICIPETNKMLYFNYILVKFFEKTQGRLTGEKKATVNQDTEVS